jgi:hypothetical protein
MQWMLMILMKLPWTLPKHALPNDSAQQNQTRPVLPHYQQLRIKMTQQQALLTPNQLPMMTPR